MSDPAAPAEAAVPAAQPEVTAAPAIEAKVDATAAVEPKADPAPAKEAIVVDAKNPQAFPAKFLKADGTPDHTKLAKAYENLEKKLGTKPNVPATSSDEYEWTPPENAAELNPDNVAKFKQMALDNGFTPKQYQFVMDSHNNVITAMLDSVGWSEDRSKEALKEAWGEDYKPNLQAAKAGFDTFAPSTANPHDPVWNHPEVMKLLARMGSEVGEDSVSAKPSVQAAADIDAQMLALRKEPDYQTNPAKQKQMDALYAKKFKK